MKYIYYVCFGRDGSLFSDEITLENKITSLTDVEKLIKARFGEDYKKQYLPITVINFQLLRKEN